MKTINVTQRDIDNGIPGEGGVGCPITLAARRIFHNVIYSRLTGIYVKNVRIARFHNHDAVAIFMGSFDSNKGVVPTKFKVEEMSYARTKH